MSKKFLFVALTVALLFLFCKPTDACQCGGQPSVCEAYQAADAVFIGVVTQVKIADGFDATKTPYPPGTAYLKVEEAFKGVEETTITLLQGQGGDCIPVFGEGQRWLIYASRDKKTKQLYPRACSRNTNLESAGDDLLYLRALPGIAEQTRLSGTLDHYGNEPGQGYRFIRHLAGTKVTVTGQSGGTHVTYSNGDGVYEFVGLPAGRYTVHVDIPTNLRLAAYSKNDVEVMLGKRGCVGVDWTIHSAGGVSGEVMDADGNHVVDVCVSLIPVEKANDKLKDRDSIRAFTNKYGEFEIEELAPGRYVMGVNVDREPSGEMPFSRTFYPGVSSPSEAAVLVVGEGEKLDNLKLLLPPRLATKVVEGTVVFSDGRTVRDGGVSLKETDEENFLIGYASGRIKEDGRFSLKVLQGTVGWIHAYGLPNPGKAGGGMYYTKPFKLEVGDDIKDLRIVIPAPEKKQ